MFEPKVGELCGRDLGRGKNCTGDMTKPGTHAPECRNYVLIDAFAERIPD